MVVRARPQNFENRYQSDDKTGLNQHRLEAVAALPRYLLHKEYPHYEINFSFRFVMSHQQKQTDYVAFCL